MRRLESTEQAFLSVTSHTRPQRLLLEQSFRRMACCFVCVFHFIFTADMLGQYCLHMTDEKGLERLETFLNS